MLAAERHARTRKQADALATHPFYPEILELLCMLENRLEGAIDSSITLARGSNSALTQVVVSIG